MVERDDPVDKRWQPGDVILNETYTGATNQPILIFPALVVDDNDEYLALYHPLGHILATADIVWPDGHRSATPIAERVLLFVQWKPEIFRQTKSRWHVLYLEPHGAMHAVWLFWDETWNLTHWYVNLQQPYERTEAGIRIVDCYLDLAVTPDLDWHWKDKDEFDALFEMGAISADLATSLRAEGEMVGRKIEAREWPFDSNWPDWRPDPTWPVPSIADYWAKGRYSFPLSPLREER